MNKSRVVGEGLAFSGQAEDKRQIKDQPLSSIVRTPFPVEQKARQQQNKGWPSCSIHTYSDGNSDKRNLND